MALDAEREGLEALDEEEGAERALAWPEVAQALDAGARDEGHVGLEGALGAEHLPELEAVVALARLGEDRVAALVPRACEREFGRGLGRGLRRGLGRFRAWDRAWGRAGIGTGT